MQPSTQHGAMGVRIEGWVAAASRSANGRLQRYRQTARRRPHSPWPMATQWHAKVRTPIEADRPNRDTPRRLTGRSQPRSRTLLERESGDRRGAEATLVSLTVATVSTLLRPETGVRRAPWVPRPGSSPTRRRQVPPRNDPATSSTPPQRGPRGRAPWPGLLVMLMTTGRRRPRSNRTSARTRRRVRLATRQVHSPIQCRMGESPAATRQWHPRNPRH